MKRAIKLEDISVKRTHNGLVLSIIYGDRYYHKLFQGYGLAEATRRFRDSILLGDL